MFGGVPELDLVGVNASPESYVAVTSPTGRYYSEWAYLFHIVTGFSTGLYDY